MSWQVMRDYPLCGRWLCTALRRGELHRTDWVRRKELFFWGCMCFYWTTCKNTNTVNVALENLTRHSGSLGSWASGALLPPQDTLRKTAWRLLSRRGLLRCPWRLFPGPGHTFLLTSGSRLGASAAVAAEAFPPFSGGGGSPRTIWNEKVAGTSALAWHGSWPWRAFGLPQTVWWLTPRHRQRGRREWSVRSKAPSVLKVG